MSSAATAELLLPKVALPAPRNRKPSARLTAMWEPYVRCRPGLAPQVRRRLRAWKRRRVGR